MKEKMPLLFVGHGNPMNSITDNEFARVWNTLGKSLPKPKAILCISAHWETDGSFVTAMDTPQTIHDFGGFPDELYQVQYSAPGSPELAENIKRLVSRTCIGLDMEWGLDHGCWSVLRHLFPLADVPVVQLSIDYKKTFQQHYEIAKELAVLREKNILIMGSGNIVHNLRMVDWQNKNTAFEWAVKTNDKIKKFIVNNDYKSLLDNKTWSKEFALAAPTVEHFIPLIYIMGIKEESEKVSFFNDKIEMGSLSMTSFYCK